MSHGESRWVFARNCALTPRQLVGVYLGLSGVSLMVALFFWLHGALLVLPFTLVELVALGTGFLIYARHATDRESLWIDGNELVVEHEQAGRCHRVVFPKGWVRVETTACRHAWVELVGAGQRVQVGRYLRVDQRPGLARALRSALAA